MLYRIRSSVHCAAWAEGWEGHEDVAEGEGVAFARERTARLGRQVAGWPPFSCRQLLPPLLVLAGRLRSAETRWNERDR